MSRFSKLSHVLWHCQYHLVWVPKYRYKILKGRTAIRIFKQNPGLKTKLYLGNYFSACGYCVDTVGLDEDMIRKYVRYQEKKEREAEQLGFKF